MSKTAERELVEFAKRELMSARSKVAALELLIEEYGAPVAPVAPVALDPVETAPTRVAMPMPQKYAPAPFRDTPPVPTPVPPRLAPVANTETPIDTAAEAKRGGKDRRRRHSNVVRPSNKDKFICLLKSLCQKPVEKYRLLKAIKSADEEFRHLTAPALSRWIGVALNKGELVRVDRAMYTVNRGTHPATAARQTKHGNSDGFIPINLLGIQAQG